MKSAENCQFFCLRLVVLFLLLATAVAASQSAALQTAERSGEAPMSLVAYRAMLDEWAETLKTIDPARQDVRRMKEALPAAWQVQAGDGAIEVSTVWLDRALEGLDRRPSRRDAITKAALARLSVLQSEAKALAELEAPVDGAAARARLDKILSRKEFAVRQPNWWDRFQARVGQWFRRLLGRIFGGLGESIPWLGKAIFWMAITLFFVLLVWWMRKYLRSAAKEVVMPRISGLPEGKNWQAWMRAAGEAGSRGQFREAIRCVYWAGIAHMGEMRVWPPDASRTPREYLRVLPPEHASAAALKDLTVQFETTWYGFADAQASDLAEAYSLAGKLGCPSPSTPATAGS